MLATDDLRAEHEGILKMLAVMEAMAASLNRGGPDALERWESVLDFLRVFADRCHHGKEEDILFPALEKAGMQRQGGPIAVMLHEHVLGRGHIAAMGEALAGLKAGKPDGGAALGEAARAYVALLTQHIAKENTVLFPMAERLLGEPAIDAMHEDFERIEAERIGPGRHEAFHALLDELSTRYLS